MDLSADYSRAAEFLRGGSHFVVAAHGGPDGDAIGSVLAMAGVLESLGKAALRYSPDPVPYQFTFLAGADRYVHELPEDGDGQWRIVLLDCSSPSRVGEAFEAFALGRPRVVLDHHVTVSGGADVLVSDPGAASVGLLVAELADSMAIELGPAEAQAIYTTIISDTGSFHYSNTSPRGLRCAARMLELGADPWTVASHLYENDPLARVRLLGEVLDTLRVSPDGRCATLLVSRAMMERWGADEDLLDGFVNYGRRVSGVEMAVLVREIGPGRCKCSMRSRGRVDVARIAQRFGGGGHHNAAGCRVSGALADVRTQLEAVAAEELAE